VSISSVAGENHNRKWPNQRHSATPLSCLLSNQYSRFGGADPERSAKKEPMSRIITLKEITAGYVLAGVTLCLGFYFSLKVGDEYGGAFLKIFNLLAALVILNFPFAGGRWRGFAVRREDGSIALGHVVRNLVMSVIVWMGVVFISAPLAMPVFRFNR
jgi:hypothetical protein